MFLNVTSMRPGSLIPIREKQYVSIVRRLKMRDLRDFWKVNSCYHLRTTQT